MFNTYISPRYPDYPRKIEITERRAPTDESIRLAEEFEEKVLQKVVQSIRFGGENELKGALVVMEASPHAYNYIVLISFELNGRDVTVQKLISKMDLKKFDRMAAYRWFIGEMAQAITEQLNEKFAVAYADCTQ